MSMFRIEKIVYDRFVQKDRALINTLDKKVEDEADLTVRRKLVDDLHIIIGGVVFEMSINKKLSFSKEFKRLSKQYYNVN